MAVGRKQYEQVIHDEIKAELDNYSNLSQNEKDHILSIIDQKISDLRILQFKYLSHDYEELRRIARIIKGFVRQALAKEYTKPSQIAIEIIGGLASVLGGVAAGGGIIYGGQAGNMALKLGKISMSGSQGISMFAKVPENFSQAEKVVLQDEMDTSKNQMSTEEEAKRESVQTYNRILQSDRDKNSQLHATKKEVLGRT